MPSHRPDRPFGDPGGHAFDGGLRALDLLVRRAPTILLAAYYREPLPGAFCLARRPILMAATLASDLALDEAVALAIVALDEKARTGDITAGTARAYAGEWARFAKYVSAADPVTCVDDVGRSHAVAFINAPVMSGDGLRFDSSSVKARRHSALKALFAELRSLAIYRGDPLLDLPPAPRTPLPYRRLTDSEINRCRFWSGTDTRDTRGPAAWALGESYATTSEIPATEIDDVDLDGMVVWLTGGARNVARWAPLTEWAAERLARRIEFLASLDGTDGRTPLIYAGTGGASGTEVSGQCSASKALHGILVRSGLGADRAARPLSIPAWRAHHAYALTGDLLKVHHDLGVRSLDRTAEIVGIAPDLDDVPPPHREDRL